MRLLSLLILLVSLNIEALHSQNLVPNPSFEDTVACPIGLTQIDYAIGWSSFRNSPDLYNACSFTGTNVPNAVFGYQNAHSGGGMAAIATYRRPNSPNGPNYREFMGCMLNSSLIQGTTYYLSFFANFSFQRVVAIASNNIGIKLSTISYDAINSAPIDNHSQLNYTTILTDSINWTKISGSFVADSAYNFLIVGNFYTDQNTDTLIVSLTPDNAYYYIDDICLSTDSLYCNNWVGYEEKPGRDTKPLIFPNPSSDFIKVKAENIQTCKIFSMQGAVCLQREGLKSNELEISLKDLPNGPYIIQIVTERGCYSEILVKN